ncbi:MAG: HGGxSTG domain-containing protein [Methyloceanibacter sp.]
MLASPRCGAKTRSGGSCRSPAVSGKTRCRIKWRRQRMVSEKTTALAEATMTLARGGSPGTVIRRYRTHVPCQSNKRRLSSSR